MAREYLKKVPLLPKSAFDPELAFFDEFSSLTDWQISGNAGDYWGKRQPGMVYQGDYALWISTRKTNPAANDYVEANRYFAVYLPQRISLSFFVRTYHNQLYNRLRGEIDIPDAANIGSFEIGVEVGGGNQKVYIKDNAGNYTEVGTIPEILDARFYRIEVVANLITRKYIEVRIGPVVIDVSTQGLYFNTGVDEGKNTITLQVSTTAAYQTSALFDSVLVRALP